MKFLYLSLLFVAVFSNEITAQTFTSVSTFTGSASPGLVNGNLASARFSGPYGICIDDATGTFYVADALNNCVRKISNGVVSTLAGNGSQGDVDGQGSNARFYAATGICFSNGYVYVTDNGNHKIKRIDTLGNVTTIAGSGTAGHLDGTALQARFNNPVNLTADNNGNILVADYGNNCIRQIINGQVVTYAGVPGGGGDQLGPVGTALFDRPTGLAMNAQGDLYVVDQVNGKIKQISGGNVTLLAGSGTNTSTDGTGASASFYRPTFIDFDLYGNLIVTEWITNKVRRVTPAGVVTTIAGTGSAGFTDGPVATATFDTPYGVCVDNTGEAYIGDKGNNSIRKISIGDVAVHDSQKTEIQLAIFPNPSADHITLSIPSGFGLRAVFIYDVRGAICKTLTVQDRSEQLIISVAELGSGQYFIVAEGEKSTGKATLIRQ